MTDKRARLEEIKQNHEERRCAEWLISELEAAWNDNIAFDQGRDEAIYRAEAAEAEVERLQGEIKVITAPQPEREAILIARAEAAEKDAAYQRRHRKRLIGEARESNGAYHCMHGAWVISEKRWKRIEADRDDLANDYDELRAEKDRLAQRVKRLEEALESLLGISHRIEGCSDSGCLICRENDRVIEQARAALEEGGRE